MSCFVVFVIFVIFNNLIQGQWVIDDDGCRTPERDTGICVAVNECQPMVDYLKVQKKPFSKEVIDKANSYTCGYDNRKVKVCCPSRPIVGANSQDPPDVSNHNNLKLVPKDCGYLDPSDKIINGENANLNEFPWMALISYQTERGPEFKCGATVINKNYVLTAAHCITNLNYKLLGVRVGEHSIKNADDCQIQINGKTKCAPPVQDVLIRQVISHPQYNSKTFSNDIGLLRVSDIDLTKENARPVCLPLGNQRTASYNYIIVTGWGVTGTGKASDILQKVSLNVTDHAACKQLYATYNITLTTKQLCAGGKDKDSCPGDSGGPMQIPAYVNNDIKYVQHGIVSFGPRFCGSSAGISGVYTLVIYYMDWILNNLKP